MAKTQQTITAGRSVETLPESDIEHRDNAPGEYVDHALEEQETRVDTRLELTEHRSGIYAATERMFPQVVQHRETIEHYMGKFENEEELKRTLDNLEHVRHKKQHYEWLFDSASSTEQFLDQVAHKYVRSEVGESGHEEVAFRSFADVMGEGENMNPFQQLWLIISHPVEFIQYQVMRSKLKKELMLYRTIDKIEEQVQDVGEKAVELNRETRQAWADSQETRERLTNFRAGNEVEKKRKAAEKVRRKLVENAREVTEDVLRSGPERFVQNISQELNEAASELAKLGPEGAEVAKKTPGLKVVHTKLGTFITFTAHTIREAIESTSLGEFTNRVAETSWWSEAAEILPIWGTIRSGQRLDDSSSMISKRGRQIEFAVNLGLDLWTAVMLFPGLIAALPTGGMSIAAILAGRGLLGKGIAKLIAKRFALEGAEELAELGLKEIAQKTGLQIGQEGAQRTGSKLTQQNARQALNQIFTKLNPTNWERAWPLIGRQLGAEGIFLAASWALTHFPIEEKLYEVGEAKVRSQLSGQQNRLLDTALEHRG